MLLNYTVKYNTGIMRSSILTVNCFASSYNTIMQQAVKTAKQFNYSLLCIEHNNTSVYTVQAEPTNELVSS